MQVPPDATPPDQGSSDPYSHPGPADQIPPDQAQHTYAAHAPAGAYGYGYPRTEPQYDDKALWALILAALGWFFFPIVLHIIALILANQSLRTIQAAQGRLAGHLMARAARIASIIGLIFYGAVILLGLVILTAFRAA